MKSSLKKLIDQDSTHKMQIDDFKRQSEIQNKMLLEKEKVIKHMRKIATEILMIQRCDL